MSARGPVSLPAGWYPDPDTDAAGLLRYFDGNDWTDHTSVVDPTQQRLLEIAERQYRGSHRVRVLLWTIVLVPVVVVVLAVLIVMIVAVING